jgi:hypothetical protein
MSIYDGFFRTGECYSFTQIQRKFRCKDPRPIDRWLKRLEIPGVEGPKGECLYLGDDILLALAEHTRCEGKPNSPDAAGE